MNVRPPLCAVLVAIAASSLPAVSARGDVTQISISGSGHVELQAIGEVAQVKRFLNHATTFDGSDEITMGGSRVRAHLRHSVSVSGDSIAVQATGSVGSSIVLPNEASSAPQVRNGAGSAGFDIYFETNTRTELFASVYYSQSAHDASGGGDLTSYSYVAQPFRFESREDAGPATHSFVRTQTLEPGAWMVRVGGYIYSDLEGQPGAWTAGSSGQLSFSVNVRMSPVTGEDPSVIRFVRPGGGPFSTAANWSPAQVPVKDQERADTALFDLPNSYPVTVGTQTTERLIVRRGSPRFVGSDYTVTATSETAPSVVVSDGAQLFLTGGLLKSVHATIGETAPSAGAVHVFGPTARWLVSGRLSVGELGAGSLVVGNGAAVGSAETLIGNGLAEGAVTVEGEATIVSTGNLLLGHTSRGSLTVQDGASVWTDFALVGLGTPPDVTNEVLVTGIAADGTPSRWNVDSLSVGRGSKGRLTVRDGGFAIMQRLSSVGDGASGILDVAGQGPGQVPSTARFLEPVDVGFGSEGRVNVTAGGLADFQGGLSVGKHSGVGDVTARLGGVVAVGIPGGQADLAIGVDGGIGTVTVDQGGVVDVGGNLHVGYSLGYGELSIGGSGPLTRVIARKNVTVGSIDAVGILRIRSNGRLECTDTVTITPQGVSGGTGLIFAPTIVNQGQVIPGLSPGRLTIEGDFVQESTGTLVIEVAGTAAGKAYDQLVVKGNATLGGKVVIQFMNGFAPRTGQEFDFLDVTGAASGNFAEVETRGLEPGAQFETTLVNGLYTTKALNDARPLATVAIKARKKASESKGRAAAFVVSRKRSTAADLSVKLSLSGRALNGVDYAMVPSTVVIPAGRKSVVVTIAPVADGIAESAETVVATVVPGSDYTHSRASRAAVSIVD